MSGPSQSQLVFDFTPAAEPTLDNYVAGANGEALSALRALTPGRAIYLWGEPGCGRSHLLNAMITRHQGRLLSPTTFEPLTGASVQAALPPLIAIDDLQALDEGQQAHVFALYNRWRESAATRHAIMLVVAGDQPPRQMPLREDLRTRLAWDLVFRLTPLLDCDKPAVLRAHAASRGVHELPDDLITWLLTHHTRDMRRLTALLNTLYDYSFATKRPVTLHLMRSMLAKSDPT